MSNQVKYSAVQNGTVLDSQVKSCQVRLRVLWQHSPLRKFESRCRLPDWPGARTPATCRPASWCSAVRPVLGTQSLRTKVESSASVCAANTRHTLTHTRTRAHSPKIQSSTRPKCCVSEPKILTWGRYRLSSRGTRLRPRLFRVRHRSHFMSTPSSAPAVSTRVSAPFNASSRYDSLV